IKNAESNDEWRTCNAFLAASFPKAVTIALLRLRGREYFEMYGPCNRRRRVMRDIRQLDSCLQP
ncbi:MAG: hypothetical protein JWO45_1298, partial [Spartobacteria bacterium]|nr:hypothetical protein [Spartobacteria bacterium]